MEGYRFDNIARSLAVPRSRRGVLRVVTGGLAAGFGALALRSGGAGAQASCTTDDDCATDEICCVGTCRAIECCIDEEDPNARCPEGTSCFEGICDPVDGGCSSDDDCADGEICCVGTCRAIECCIDEADPNARCPAGTSCFEGVCDPVDGGRRRRRHVGLAVDRRRSDARRVERSPRGHVGGKRGCPCRRPEAAPTGSRGRARRVAIGRTSDMQGTLPDHPDRARAERVLVEATQDWLCRQNLMADDR
jgi:hypothetical protein